MKYLVSRSCEYVNSFDTKQCRNAVCRFMWVFIYLYIVVSCGLDLAEAAKEMGISWNPCIPYKKTKNNDWFYTTMRHLLCASQLGSKQRNSCDYHKNPSPPKKIITRYGNLFLCVNFKISYNKLLMSVNFGMFAYLVFIIFNHIAYI